MITGKDGAWHVKSEDGSKHLGGPYKTKAEAEKRLKQVEWFKSHPKESAMEKIVFIDATRGVKAILLDEKFLVTDKDGTGHLPVDDATHMGAAWAALHGGYRGNKYEGPDKSKAVAKLKAMYKAKGMDTPAESFAITGGAFWQEALAKDDSYDSLRSKVQAAVNANIAAGTDMDCDDDGPQDAAEGKYAYVMDLFPGEAIYSMNDGELYKVGYAVDADGDVHLGPPEEVQLQYDAKQASMHAEPTESFTESYCGAFVEAARADGAFPVTVIKPGWSKNGRYYSSDLLKGAASMFEGAKMFADHATDREMKERPEGSVNGWVANLTGVAAESDGTLKGFAVPVDPAFKAKLDLLQKQNLLGHMGVSIRAYGGYDEGEAEGKRGKIVENFKAVRSVDFVTFAGAGGQVEA